MRTPRATKTFCPREQFVPISAPVEMWQKCQIFVPSPMRAPSSTYAIRECSCGRHLGTADRVDQLDRRTRVNDSRSAAVEDVSIDHRVESAETLRELDLFAVDGDRAK